MNGSVLTSGGRLRPNIISHIASRLLPAAIYLQCIYVEATAVPVPAAAIAALVLLLCCNAVQLTRHAADPTCS